MIQTFYTVMFILSFALTILLISVNKKITSVYYTLLFAGSVFSNLGYMQLYSSENISQAISANQVIYCAGCFTPFFCLMCIADLCNVKIGRLFQGFWVALGCIILTLIMTVELNDIYYLSAELVQEDGYVWLDKEYGPLHLLYPVYLLSMLGVTLFIILNSFRKKRKISYVTSTILVVIMSFTVTVYIAERLAGAKLDYMPLCYVMIQMGIVVLLNRITLYDISAVSGDSMTNSMDYGIIICSKNGRLCGIDHASREWFPELEKLVIDSTIIDDGTDILHQIVKWINGDKTPRVMFERDGKFIEARHSFLERKSGDIHCIYLRDETNQQQYLQLVENFNDKLESEVNEKTDRLRQVQSDIIISMASIVENRDNNTGGHIKRTSDIVQIFVDHLMITGRFSELDPKVAECITKAAPLHDFGKIAIPDIILNKPGKFTNEEYEQMKNHSAKGAVIVERILQNSDDILFKNIAVNIAHFHHEKWNGTGYPSRLAGKAIPFEARVMALADVFDALVSKRVYKESYSFDKAFDIIESSGGEHFDPRLCNEFLQCRPQLEALFNSYTD